MLQLDDHQLHVLNEAILEVSTAHSNYDGYNGYTELQESIDNLRLVWAQIYSIKEVQ